MEHPTPGAPARLSDLFVVRLADETVVASSDVGMSFEFAETDGSVMSEIEMQAAELLGKRIRKRGEGRDARDTFARIKLWNAGRQKIAEALEKLTGGQFDLDGTMRRGSPDASNVPR